MQNLSFEGEENVGRLVALLKARLSSESKVKSTDQYGNEVYTVANIFSDEMLEQFLALSLSEFNQTPYFTFYTFNDTKVVEVIADLLVEGATLNALASKALIERGREFSITDNAVTFNPPSMSETLQTQWASLLTHHFEKLKYIKNRFEHFPK